MTTLASGNGPVKRLGSKQLFRVLLGTAAMLMVPLVAMQFTREVNWTAGDFVAAAVLLAGMGMLVEVAAARLCTRRARLTAVAVIALGFALVWAELAVGIVGSPLAGS